MSPKKKKPAHETPNHHISGYFPVFSPDFKADLAWWYRTEPKKGDKILDLVADILNGEPFTGLGKPEPLKYIAPDTGSRRIDLEHRLVYKVTENKVYFLQARYHYQSD
ncbi:Txe/YoeB family addiction module toxin [Arthrospira platensis]|uniref:Txe/YoeB family addiction module toxin n=1 Tax=Limnospira TaxID=2596745 RepID=UPI0001C388D5|nr:Txe/YoeB family addiction module toxin [Arthrospira platensis]AMW28287.1 addiction module toxin YoeB [Arthrospira platensis YZ]KDR55700.1 addiction module toxin YoeB [Arthrospira platensis str. Paraca]MBD2670732.1 Txe/YoeB family addiction module toxin [Arthrospira platensis FACHB-439]MBD2710289.1 Txe/YoeB family addiction module toxin [Arthrospira platensis FACHB-835]MDT9183860.1 Txe/YoeB family addiction module toxin [Limnospira sp. PMC 289.06]MDT9311742.1 Txe/YoeB family addiction modul